MTEHWRQVSYSILDGLFSHWKQTNDNISNDIVDVFELQDQCELDSIDLEHYLETQGA